MKLGSIPERVTYFLRPSKTHRTTWDDIDASLISVDARAAFVSDSTNKKTLATGENWQQQRRWVDGKLPDQHPVEKLDLVNAPTENVRIVGLEVRDRGGRAYKAVLNDTLYVDLREDVLLETILDGGIEAGGRLNGSYVWARVNSDMKLVRVGSVLHQRMIEATQFQSIKPFTKEQLQVGRIYENKKGDHYVYLGHFWCDVIQYRSTNEGTNWMRPQGVCTLITDRERKQRFCFAHVWSKHSKVDEQWYRTELSEMRKSSYRYNFVDKPSFRIATPYAFDSGVDWLEVIADVCKWIINRDRRTLDRQPRDVSPGELAYYSQLFSASLDKEASNPLLEPLQPGNSLADSDLRYVART